MSRNELDRVTVLGRVAERSMTQVTAAKTLGLSVRQVRRLLRAYEAEGAQGLIS